MINWLLVNPAGIGILTIVAAALVAGAAWAASAVGFAVLAAVVGVTRRHARQRDTGDS